MPSLVELAELSKASYGNDTSVPIAHQSTRFVWSRDQFWSRSSFFAALYTRPGSCRVLAFRGTDDLLDGLSDDLSIARGSVPPTVSDANEAVGKLGNSNLLVTGHSLGGALAVIAACGYKLPAVTFNAPGVMDSCILAHSYTATTTGGLRGLMLLLSRCITGPQVRNIRIDADPVSSFFTTGFQAGSTQTYGGSQCGIDLLCRHKIDTCVNAVRARSDGFKPVKF